MAGKRGASGGWVRIVGGSHRGRRLRVPAQGVRPTPDRVRETLFNWLAPELPGARCLDLFAGTGVLGLEALSRGASHAVLLEHHRATADALRGQAEALGLPAVVHRADALAWLRGAPAEAGGPFHVVFLDPPYGRGLLQPCCDALASGGWLAEDARVYIETESARGGESVALPAGWALERDRTFGGSRVRIVTAAGVTEPAQGGRV